MLQKNKIIIAVVVILGLSVILGGVSIYQNKAFNNLQVIYFDVGHGDSILIKTPSQQKILIDGGPDNTVIHKLGKYLPFYDKKLDLVILTHPDADHATGLVKVLKKYQVKKILITGVLDNSPPYQDLLKTIENRGVPKETVVAGKKIELEDKMYLEVLYPIESLAGKSVKPINDSSLIVKLNYGLTSFLFMGDAQKSVEEELLNRQVDLKADVLKVAHHGSDTSSSKSFLNAVLPKLAVISVGKNDKSGLPSLKTIKNLERRGAKVLRTDLSGDINITSNGSQVELE